MAKLKRITIADLERASEQLSKMGAKTRAGRTVARHIGMSTVNEWFKYLVNQDIQTYGISPTQEELEDVREGYIQELVRGANLLPMGQNFETQIRDIYERGQETGAAIEQSRVANRVAQSRQQLQDDLSYLGQDRNFQAVYELLGLAKDSFIQSSLSQGEDYGKGYSSYRDWYYQYTEQGTGKGRINWQTFQGLMSQEELHEFVNIVKSAERDNRGRPKLADNSQFVAFTSKVGGKIMQDALGAIQNSPQQIAARVVGNKAGGFGL